MLEYYYHSTVRKVVVGFASLFNDIYVSRKGQSGAETERIRVPLAYGPQQKFLRRLDRIGTDFDQQAVRLETYLPRMSFEINSLQYDSARKLNSIQQTVGYNASADNKLKRRYERVPYNMQLTVGVMTKTAFRSLSRSSLISPPSMSSRSRLSMGSTWMSMCPS